ncbi:DUF1232 domain-containing protein [bacterium]|nr:DUF1232 domain-containing protein [bacterium]
MNKKTKIIIAVLVLVAYIISPVDFVPDAAFPVGYIDDGALTVLTIIYVIIQKLSMKK